MEIKILQVFYDKNGLPYKDKERTVHYPITSGTFLGASNTTQIRFYYDQLDELNESTFVAVSKLPNGNIGSEILESEYDSELQESYAVLNLSQFYTQYKGDVFISLQGYQGGVRVEQDEDGIYQIYGTPTIQATGSIRMYVAYAPTFVGSGQTENITLQRVLAELSTKLGIRQETLHVEELPTVGNPNVWYVINNDPNDTTKANIYIWNATTQTYVWVGDNTLNLGNYYTHEQGEQFEEEIDNRVSSVENELSSVAQGSPKGAYATLSDLESAYPTGTAGIYVVQADGHWYYWNGSAWTDGGVYLSTSDAITSEALDIFTVKKNCPWIKEIYINEIGKARDVSAVWNVFASPALRSPWIAFANSAENAITGYAMNLDNKKSRIVPIYDGATFSVILGYVIIDWNLYPTVDTDPTTKLLDYAYNKDYSPSIKEYLTITETKLKEINALINGGDKVTELYTFNLPDSVSGNTSYIWFPVYKWVRKINKISYLSNTGVVNFYKVKVSNGTATSTLIASETNTSDEDLKIKSIYVDVELEDDEYIGINGSFFYDGTERNYKCSTVTVADGSVGNPNAQTMFFNCEYDENFGSKIESLEKYSNNKGRCVLYNAKLTSENSDLVLGTQTFDSYGLVVNTTSGAFRLNKYYAIEERTVTYVVKFSSDCFASFKSYLAYSVDPSTNFVIDIPTRNTGLMEGGLPTVRCGLLSNYNHEFAISIKKYYMNYIVEIRDLNSGAYWKQTFTRNGQGGAGQGAIGTLINVPMQWDMYGFQVTNGSMSVSQIIITAPKCDILLYGDSITEPEAYYPLNQFPYSWTQLLRKVAGRKKVVTSGRSGTVITQIMQRIANELPFIKPKYCMITIGTNGLSTFAELTELIQYIKSCDAIPILNHIPCYNNNGNTTGFITANQIIDQIRQSENIKGADLDKATSINNDGQTLDETTMWLETYSDNSTYRHHPNMKGSERIITRILIDVPEIFGD